MKYMFPFPPNFHALIISQLSVSLQVQIRTSRHGDTSRLKAITSETWLSK